MKHLIFHFIILIFCNFLIADDSKPIIANFEDINKDYKVSIEIQNSQVLFAKPLSKILLNLNHQTKKITVLEQNKNYAFQSQDQEINIKLPDENKVLEIELVLNNNEMIKFKIVTAIIDKDTDDGEIKFEDNIYTIGKYPAVPKYGKTNYFKDKYIPPKYFFIWNPLFEDLPVSKNLKYGDLVVKPDPEKPDLPRPPRATKIFTLSYETILNFEKIIEKARLKSPFKKVSILSFYRTPEYNRKIGAASFSRHIYGDGIDWFIDEDPENDEMDDLNNDGKVSQEDAKSFVQVIIQMVSDREIKPCGTGVYFTKKGASLHYDSRGHLARWGASELWWPDKDLPTWLLEIEKNVKEKDNPKSPQ